MRIREPDSRFADTFPGLIIQTNIGNASLEGLEATSDQITTVPSREGGTFVEKGFARKDDAANRAGKDFGMVSGGRVLRIETGRQEGRKECGDKSGLEGHLPDA